MVKEENLARHGAGEAKAAGARDCLAVFLEQQRTECGLAGAAAEQRVRLDAGEHLLHDLRHEKGLEVLRRAACLHRVGGARQAWAAVGGGERQSQIEDRQRKLHHLTSMSACRAPADLIACRMAIMSRGPTPSVFRLLTSSCRLTPEGRTASLFFDCSSTWMSVRGTVVVVPVLDNGLGCDTCGVSVMRMVRLPWAIATVLMRTLSPMTMMPDSSSMTTRAIWSGSTGSCSISVSSATVAAPAADGTARCTVPGSSGSAARSPMCRLIASATRRAVVKSGLRSEILTLRICAMSKPSSRSIMAPLAMPPPVGTPFVTDWPSPSALNPPMATA